MTTGKTLKTEYDSITQRMDSANDDESDMSPAEREGMKQLEQDIYGENHARDLHYDLANEILRSKIGVPHHIWNDPDLYPDLLRGKLAAVQIIKNQLEMIERFYETMKRNRQAEETKRNRETQKKRNANRSRSRTQRPRRKTNRWTRR